MKRFALILAMLAACGGEAAPPIVMPDAGAEAGVVHVDMGGGHSCESCLQSADAGAL